MKFSNSERQVNTHSLLVRKLAVLAVAFAMLITSPGMAFMAYATETAADKQTTAEQSDAPKSEITDETQKSDAEATDEVTEETQTDDAEESNPAESESKLSEQTLEVAEDDYEIVVSGTLPEGAYLEVVEIADDADDYEDYVKGAAEAVFEEEKALEGDSLPYARFFDITIKDADGNAYEPTEEVALTINPKDDDVLKTEDVTFKTLHFEDTDKEAAGAEETPKAEIVESKIEDKDDKANLKKEEEDREKVLALDVPSFSVYGVVYFYTVDFFYNDAEHHMNGGSEMMMSELFGKLGIEKDAADISAIEFTDESLVTFTKTGSDYRITSLKPFTTGEMLTITFSDGEVISIIVEDEIASGTFGSNLKWSIDDDGHFILEPASGSNGTITSQYSSATEAGGTTPRTSGRTLWPWEKFKDKIVTAEIKGEIRTYGGDNNYALQGMFEWCENMVSVDVSGLNTSRLGDVSFFFANCPKLKTITGLDAWTNSVSQADNVQYGVGNIRSIASMFRNCTSLEEIDLSAWTSNGKMKNFQNMCTGCTSLKTFTLNNPDFKTAADSQWHTGSNGPFKDCNALETVDMSNITIATNANGLKELFAGLSSLKEVTMKDINFTQVKNMESMFNNCQSLETLTFSPKEGIAFINNTNMDNFFANCSKLKTLDITNLDNSALTSNHEMGFEDLDSLTTLKADNSNVWIDKNGANYTNMENVNMVRDIDFIQDATFEYTPSPVDPNYSGSTPLTIDSAEVIELVVKDGTSRDTIGYTNTNNKGMLSPGTYVRTSDIVDSDMEVPLTYYIIDGMDENMPIIEFFVDGVWKKWDNSYEGLNDQSYSVGDMGDYYVYTYYNGSATDTRILTKAKTNAEWADGTDTETDSYAYEGGPIRITYPKSATSINGTKHDVVITINSISFEDMSRIPNTTDATYTNYDENFEPEVIPNPWGPGSYRPDKNKIPGYPGTTYDNNNKTRRYLLNASIGELRFWNQVTKEGVTGGTSGDAFAISQAFLYSKGSGTNINFNLNVDGAEDGQSVLYWCDDLDMPENESWSMPTVNPNDDVRNAVNYAPGAEGIVLGEGNDLSSVTLANRTYLKLYNYADGTKKDAIETDGDIQGDNNVNTPSVANYLIGSRPDPETLKTRFYVKSNAKGSNYIWTTGTSCETTVLKSTSFERADILDVHLNAKAGKTVNGKALVPGLNRTFNFVMKPASNITKVTVNGEDVPNKADVAFPDPIKVKNEGGNVDFGKMTFLAPNANFVNTGKRDPINGLYIVYMDSDNKKFYYKTDGESYSWTETIKTEQVQDTDENGNPLFDGDGNPIMVDKETIDYNETEYTPVVNTTKAYVFKITETQGSETYITDWDGTEYYLKVVTIAPATDEEMQTGTKMEVTIGTKAKGAEDVTWGATTTKYGSDTKDNPLDVNVGAFNNKADEVELPKGTINVKKILDGRNWKSGDKFHFMLTTEESATPMPTGSQKKDGIRIADLVVDTSDIKVDEHSYKDSVGFNEITFTGAHMVNEKGAPVDSKIFTYHIREEVPAESGDERIAGITYSTERYGVQVTVKKVDGELKIDKTEIFPIVDDQAGTVVDIASFTNTYNANKTVYKMSAEKSFDSSDTSKMLQDGDYEFVLKPIGDYAAIAPMPKNSTGSGDQRTLTVKNIGQGVNFEDRSDSDDGLRFIYQDEGSEKGLLTLLLPYFDNDKAMVQKALHSDKGVDFEYEMYEVIPSGAVNNDNGTWSVVETDGHASIYDGIHHIRKITVKVRPKEGSSTEEELYVVGHADDHKEDFYLDKNGNEQPVSKISGYDEKEHHMAPDGAPVFCNYYVEPVKVDPPVKKVVEGTEAKDPFTYTFKPVSNTAGINVNDMPMPGGSSGGQKQITHEGPGEYEFGEFAISIPGTYVYEITEEEGDLNYDYDTSKYTVTYVVEIKNNKLQATTTITKAGAKADEAVFTNSYLGDAKIDGDETYGIKGKVQTGKPDYKVNPKNPVTPTGLIDPADGKAKKTVSIPKQGTYTLNEDGTITFKPEVDYVGDPTPVSVEGSDKNGNAVTAPYKPHVVDPTDKQDATRTVHFTYESMTGEKVTSDVTQTVPLTRHAAEVNAKTGEVTKWGDWEPATFLAVDNPDDKDVKEGWSTTDKVGEQKVTEPGAVKDVYVIYTLDKYTVTFEDGDHGKSSGGKAEKNYGDKPQANTVTPNDGYGFTGEYDYVITDKNGEEIEKGTTKDPQSITVKGNIVFTPKYEELSDVTGDETWGAKNETQTGKPDYKVNPKNPVTPTGLIDPADGKAKKTVSIPKQGTYTLNEDGTITFKPEADYVGKPTPIDVVGKDLQGNEKKATYTPHVVDNVENKSVNRTVKYVYSTGEPAEKDVVQTLEFVRTGKVDPKTGEVSYDGAAWEPVDGGTFPAVISPEIENWIPDRKEVGTAKVSGDSDNITEKVIYSPEGITTEPAASVDLKNLEQSGKPTFTPKVRKLPSGEDNTVTVKLIDPESGESVDSVTVKGGTYKLNEDGSITFTPEEGFTGNPDPISVKGTDKLGNEPVTTYTPRVVDPVDTDKATRTVHFKYKDKDGKEVTDDVVQELTLTRHATSLKRDSDGKVITDEDGEPVVDKWDIWEPATFPAVTNPDKEAGAGWTTSDRVSALTVKEPGKVDDEYVVYVKKHYTVTYEDGEHGSSNGGSKDKEYGDTPQGNKVKADDGYKFTGRYKYVITDENGKIIDSGTTDNPKSIEVIGNIVFTPEYEKIIEPEPEPDNDSKTNPKSSGGTATGDYTRIGIWVALIAAAMAAIIFVIIRRRRRS